jgi:hypothetical protein
MQSSNDYNVISKWSPEEKKYFRQSAIHNILATDMACHNDLVKDITIRALNPKPFDITQEDERRSLYRILLHNADLSNTVRPFHINRRICSLIAEEFRTQAKKEKENGLTVTPHMLLPDEISVAKGEIGNIFINSLTFKIANIDIRFPPIRGQTILASSIYLLRKCWSTITAIR